MEPLRGTPQSGTVNADGSLNLAFQEVFGISDYLLTICVFVEYFSKLLNSVQGNTTNIFSFSFFECSEYILLSFLRTLIVRMNFLTNKYNLLFQIVGTVTKLQKKRLYKNFHAVFFLFLKFFLEGL